MEAQVRKMMAAINVIVTRGEGTWQEKRDLVLSLIDEDDRINFEEFVGWFAHE